LSQVAFYVIFEGIRLLVPERPIGLYFLEIVEIVGIVGIVEIVGIVGIVTIVKRSLGYGLLRLNNSTLIELI
jgi:hypothetical protein